MLGLSLPTLISRVITLVIAFTVHEFAHAWTADRFGDDTPRLFGRLTLNPLAHLDPIGSLMLLVAGFGWAKPVPINPYRLERQSRTAPMWVALAGPFSNFLLALLAAIPLRLGLVSYTAPGRFFPTLYSFLFSFIQINLLLMLFNLIPLSPLDGEKVAQYAFPPRWSAFFDRIRPYGPMILMVIVFVLPMIGLDLLGWVLRPALNGLLTLLI